MRYFDTIIEYASSRLECFDSCNAFKYRYKDGKFYDDNTGASGYSTTFTDLEKGTYTVYLMEGSEKRYEYSGNTFTIIEPNFILNDERVFEILIKDKVELIFSL